MLNTKWIKKNQNTRLYHTQVPIVGLTGGIASGKSTAAELFRQQNIPVIDADSLVKSIYRKKETVEFIKNNFPNAIQNGAIDFSLLRELAFSTPTIKKKLEDFIYALLPEEFSRALQELPPSEFIVYDVPLLFEKGLDQFIDATICVYIARDQQLERLMNRDGIDRTLAEKILGQQMDIEDKKNKADLVIDNTGSPIEMRSNFNTVFEKLNN
jgi:dephospho-CoA kinase